MTPKEYLMQIVNLERKIKSKTSERNEIMQTLIKSTDTSQEPVYSNQTSNPTEDVVMRLMEYNDQTNKYIDDLVDLKIQIADEVMELENDNHQMVLRERYIRQKKFEKIAVDMSYDYSWIIKLHGRALKEFGEKFPEKFKESLKSH